MKTENKIRIQKAKFIAKLIMKVEGGTGVPQIITFNHKGGRSGGDRVVRGPRYDHALQYNAIKRGNGGR